MLRTSSYTKILTELKERSLQVPREEVAVRTQAAQEARMEAVVVSSENICYNCGELIR